MDDDQSVRSFFADVLRQAGYQTVEAASGKSALRMCGAARVEMQAVVLDLCMEDGEGLETMLAIRQRHPQLKCVIVSGAFGRELLDIAKTLGADAVLPKPVAPEVLLSTVSGLFEPGQHAR